MLPNNSRQRSLHTRLIGRLGWSRTWAALAIAIVIATLASFTPLAGVFDGFEDRQVNWRFSTRELYRDATGGVRRKSPRVCIIATDAESHRQDAPEATPREELAQVIRRIAGIRSATIILNVPLNAQSDPKGDADLVAAMRESGRVMLPAILAAYGEERYYRIDPVPEFARAAMGVGIGPMSASSGTKVNRVALYKGKASNPWIFLPALTYARMYGLKPGAAAASITLRHSVGQMTIPTDASRSFYLNYPGPPGTIPSVLCEDVVHGRIKDEYWRGQVVIIGSIAGSAVDRFAVPAVSPFMSPPLPPMSGSELMAVAMDNLLSEDFLTPAGALWRSILVYALSLLAACLLARLRTVRGLLAVAALLLVFQGVSLALFIGLRLVIPMSAPMVAALLSCLFILAYVAILTSLDRQRAVELGRTKSDYIAFLAHELRAPLTAIQGFAQTLRGNGDEYGVEQRQEFLWIIESEAERLVRMINDFTNIAKMEAGVALELHVTEVDVTELIRQIVARTQPRADRHELVVEAPESPPVLRADRDKLDEIIANLIDNAVKYSPGGGRVTIRVAVAPGAVRVTVSDEGIGMTPEQLANLFRRYSRVVDSGHRIKGTGLGLYLVKGLVEAHGGKIWAESEYGKGSSFHFEIPYSEEPADESGRRANASAATQGKHL